MDRSPAQLSQLQQILEAARVAEATVLNKTAQEPVDQELL
jgi:hypothetical protein